MVPLNIDKRFVLLRGSSGFYTYAIYERPTGWPDFNLNQTRVTFKLRKDRFHYMAIADNKQRLMPSPDDRMPNRCNILTYPEAVFLSNPGNPSLQGEVDDKYQYSCDNRENRVHGWISFDPMVGFWVITPSDEFRNGGPIKQNLTSHVGPTSLAMFHSAHYAGEELCPKFRSGEAWQKVFGPVFIYLNSSSREAHPFSLWQDAKLQMIKEVQSWPYGWPESPLFRKRPERGYITGQLLVHDKYAVEDVHPARFAFLGLSTPGEKGSWQKESKSYQFWSQADENGLFSIENVCPGTYNLYGWVPGVLGDYMKEGLINIYSGCRIDVGILIYEPPRDGPTIWEIGLPDRTAAEFFIPDPKPCHINKLFLNHPERFRQYGLWERYSEIFKDNDLIYTVGTSDWRRDWCFAHTCRIENDGSFRPATWQIKFQLRGVEQNSLYKLRLAIASSTNAAIQVRFNDANIYKPHFDTMQFGKDNAIARHGNHGLYHLFNIDVSGNWICQLICLVPIQIARAENNGLHPLLDGFQIPPHHTYADSISLANLLCFGLYDAVLSQWDGKIMVVSSIAVGSSIGGSCYRECDSESQHSKGETEDWQHQLFNFVRSLKEHCGLFKSHSSFVARYETAVGDDFKVQSS